MKIIISILLLFTLLVFARTNYGQDEVVRVDTSLVTIPATVLDRDGRYLTKLKKEDFQIFEDNVEQKVEFFEPTDAPVTILFLIDVSSSMSPHKENLTAALNDIFKRLRPNDQIMAESFFQWTKNLLGHS